MGIEADSTHSKVNVSVAINGVKANALVYTGSTMSHMSNEFSKLLELELLDSDCCVGLAVKGCTSKSLGSCVADIELMDKTIKMCRFLF